jgi:hypothetical protein
MSKAIHLFILTLAFSLQSWSNNIAISATKDAETKKQECDEYAQVPIEDWGAALSTALGVQSNDPDPNPEKPNPAENNVAATDCPQANKPKIVTKAAAEINTKKPEQMTEEEKKIQEQSSKLVDKIQRIDLNLISLAGLFSEEAKAKLTAALPKESDYQSLKRSNIEGQRVNISAELNAGLDNIHQLNSAFPVKEITKEYRGKLLQDGMKGSIQGLIKNRTKLVKHSFFCISQTEKAETSCNKARSAHGKKAADVMAKLAVYSQAVSGAVGNSSASQFLQASGTAFTSAREYLIRAQIRCGNDIKRAETSCNKAISFAEKLNEELEHINISNKNINVASINELVQIGKDRESCEAKKAQGITCTPSESAVDTRETAYNKIKTITEPKGNLDRLIQQLVLDNNNLKNKSTITGDFNLENNKNRAEMLSHLPYAEHSQIQSSMMQNAMQAFTSLSQIGGSSNGAQETAAATIATAAKTAQILSFSTSTEQTNSSKINNEPGVSAVAGFANKEKSLVPTTASDASTSNLSLDAQKALAATSDKPVSETSSSANPTFKSSAAASSSSSGGGSSAANSIDPGGKTATKKEEAEESKSIGSTFSNAVGSFFKGSFFGGGRSTTNSKQKSNPDTFVKTDIKRSMASQQARSEVSNASGVSNWEKVKLRYKNQNDSLINN